MSSVRFRFCKEMKKMLERKQNVYQKLQNL